MKMCEEQKKKNEKTFYHFEKKKCSLGMKIRPRRLTIINWTYSKKSGMIMDENLKRNLHFRHLEKKLAPTASILCKLRHKLPTQIKKLIYKLTLTI
jgi:hypothetical protein